jgi:hypothetical protein
MWHSDSECVLAFLDIARIDTRKSDPNPDFPSGGPWVVHITQNQHIARSALLFVPNSFHEVTSCSDIQPARNNPKLIRTYKPRIVSSQGQTPGE